MYMPARLNALSGIMEVLMLIAEEAARLAAQAHCRRTRRSRGRTLRPGSATPLWNELAAEIRRLVGKRGEKARLGRFLGLPRQRVHEFLMEGKACPDAERTLRLIVWVAAKRRARQ